MSKLTPAPWSLVPRIINQLQSDFPNSHLICSTLQVFQSWSKNGAASLGYLFTPGGKIDEYGTCVINIPTYRNNVFFHSLNPNLEAIQQLVSTCKFIDWSKRFTFGPIHERFRSIAENIVNEKEMPITIKDDSVSLLMDKEEAKRLELNVPDDVYLADLKEEHAELINSMWPHKDGQNSLDMMKQTINMNGGVGVYLKETHELVSWALFCMYGGPGMLYTVPHHLKKGYGSLAGKAILRYVGQRDIHPQGNVLVHNSTSLRLCHKIGYKYSHRIFWIEAKKNN